MPDQDSHPIRNTVIGTVVGGAILAALAYFVDPVKRVAEFLWAKMAAVLGLLTDAYSVPGWVLLVLAVLALATVVRMIRSVIRSEGPPDFLRYVEDDFYGMHWRWHWVGLRFELMGPYCPTCDTLLIYSTSSAAFDKTRTLFHCEHCGKDIASMEGDHRFAEGAIMRAIDRNVRTREWKSRVASDETGSNL